MAQDPIVDLYIRVSQISGTIVGVHIIRTIVFGGLYWGPPFWETTIWRIKFRRTWAVARRFG